MHHATQNLVKNPCLYNNNTALIKQISLFDTALGMHDKKITFGI